MKKKFHLLLIILTLGHFLSPMLTYACGTKTMKRGNACCKTEKNKKDCCKKSESKNKKDNNSCNGKCNNLNCIASTSVNFTTISFYENNFKNLYFNFLEEKLKFYHAKTLISSGFTTIWLIPKIG